MPKNNLKKSIDSKNLEFVKRLAEIGLTVSKSVVSNHRKGDGSTLASLRIETNSVGKVVSMSVVAESEAILFLEFGSGATYSGTTNPKSGELGYGPGTYPGSGNWDNPNGWWFLNDNGVWQHSFGIRADMPMYKASRKMREMILKIAREVYRK